MNAWCKVHLYWQRFCMHSDSMHNMILLHLHLFVINEWMYNRKLQYYYYFFFFVAGHYCDVFFSLSFYGSIILPMKRGIPAASFHSIRTKGRRAEKLGKEREKEMLVAAAASTPFSVSEREALWRMSEMNDSCSPGNIPHKLGFMKRSDKPERRGEVRRILSWFAHPHLICFLLGIQNENFLSVHASFFRTITIHCCQSPKSTIKWS